MALVFGDISIGDWANCEVKTDRTKKRNNKVIAADPSSTVFDNWATNRICPKQLIIGLFVFFSFFTDKFNDKVFIASLFPIL